MANPTFEIKLGGLKVWTIEILTQSDPTKSDRGIISVKDKMEKKEKIFKVFSDQFLNVPGIHFSTLKSGFGSYLEVKYALDQFCDGVWGYSESNIPEELGTQNIPEGFVV